MNNRLYVGNLAYSLRDEDLHARFAEHGTVTSARVMMDRETGRSKGFAFVEMESPAAAQSAIRALDGQPFDGRPWVVNEARPREDRASAPRGGFGGGGYRR